MKEDSLVNPDGPSQHATRRLARDLVRDDVARAMAIRDQVTKQTDTARPQSRRQSRLRPRRLAPKAPQPWWKNTAGLKPIGAEGAYR